MVERRAYGIVLVLVLVLEIPGLKGPDEKETCGLSGPRSGDFEDENEDEDDPTLHHSIPLHFGSKNFAHAGERAGTTLPPGFTRASSGARRMRMLSESWLATTKCFPEACMPK